MFARLGHNIFTTGRQMKSSINLLCFADDGSSIYCICFADKTPNIPPGVPSIIGPNYVIGQPAALPIFVSIADDFPKLSIQNGK